MNFENKREKALAKLVQAIEAAECPSQVDELWHDVEALFNGPIAQGGPFNPPGEGGGNGEPPDPP